MRRRVLGQDRGLRQHGRRRGPAGRGDRLPGRGQPRPAADRRDRPPPHPQRRPVRRRSARRGADHRLRHGGGPGAVEGSGQDPALRGQRHASRADRGRAHGLFAAALTYNTHNLLVRDAEREFLPLAAGQDAGVLLGGVFHGGLLSGDAGCQSLTAIERFYEKGDPGLHETARILEGARRLQKFAGGSGSDLRRLGIRFALSHPAVSSIVSGIRSIAEIEENASAVCQGPLSDDELARLAEVTADLPEITWRSPAAA